ncbi:anti-sigma factor [Aquisalimonas sp. 2447]|uniref:anti-sigma factor family protein n=1 Tax=Aquisalimonas sp. 2447 TaxID=2740807 RepID=UPI0014323623|nr:zf-HC2 domain-containing protein [Aquisalimonas sp. 2447]QIT55258.1 anti-sigma factor [Aquisalimonas sp. 2447]
MRENRLSCEELAEKLFAYLDADLDETTSAQIQRHLETCDACRSRVEFEKRLRTRVQESGTQQAPRQLHRRIKKILDRH